MKEGDSELVSELTRGNETAYQILLGRHLGPVTHYVRRMTGTVAEAEDIVQETFIRLWTHADRYDPDSARLSTWLHNIAHNLTIDYFRKTNRLVAEEEHSAADESVADAEEMNLDNSRDLIKEALMQIPERQRSAIIMCHYQGMSNKEAAAILDVSVDALESLMARGRRRLRTLLAELRP